MRTRPLGLHSSLGWSLSEGPVPRYDPLSKNERRAAMAVGGVVLVTGGVLFTVAAVALSSMPIGG